jgi:phosphoglycolate phosphatase-like HAD superfamily hydrolase
MQNNYPKILALDFDGVICDGLIEYFETAWHTYCQIWGPSDITPEENLAPIFYRLRPVIETGWEMPVLIRALLLGISEDNILLDWHSIAQRLLSEEGRKATDIGIALDTFRDHWISSNLEEWLSLHRFYPGIIERLNDLINHSSVNPIIITTKEGRFVKELLHQGGLEMPQERIIGKEYKKPKHQVLRELFTDSGADSIIWFIEDRLKTLLSVQQQPDLDSVRLFLADWGYNTLAERESVSQYPPIQLLSLSQFSQDFNLWPPNIL